MTTASPMFDANETWRARPHGRCEVCGRVVQVFRDGTCRPHKPPGHYGWDADHCQGSGYRQARWPVGQLLRHHAGDVWEVAEDRAGTTPWRDYLMRCLQGREKGRVMSAHGEYMHRHGWTAIAPRSLDGEHAGSPPTESPAEPTGEAHQETNRGGDQA